MILEITLFVAAAVFLHHYWHFGYWKRRNVFYIPGEPVFGSIRDIILRRRSFFDFLNEIYWKHKCERLIGFFGLYKPMLLITDTTLVQKVLVSDFNSFSDNGFCMDVEVDPMFGINPFCTKGLEKWKAIRGIQAPMQTTLKLKEMVPQVVRVGQGMVQHLRKGYSEPFDVKEVTNMYTMDNVASCAYGLQPSAFTDVNNGFKKHADKTLFHDNFLTNAAAIFFPTIGRLLSLRIVTEDAENFFVAMVKQVMDLRRDTNTQRKDLIDHLIKMNRKRRENHQRELTDLELAGHCVTFYLDGFETCSSSLSFLLLELSNHPQVQERLREEIMSAGSDLDHFDYDKVQSLKYLEMVLNESLRMHPLLPILSRMCTLDTTLDGVKISKGTKVFVPAASLHRDPELFPGPETFDPERFSQDNKSSISNCSYLPFGDGPRTCVGSKFALLQLKLAVISILIAFKISPPPGVANNRIQYDDTAAFVVIPKLGTKLKFDPLH